MSVRKDIDKGSFDFPEKQELKLCLADILDKEVDEKYYLSEKMLEGFKLHNENHFKKGTGFIRKPKEDTENANCLRANASLCPTDNTIKVVGNTKSGGERSAILGVDGICSCLTATDYKQPKQILQVGNLKTDSKRKDPQVGRVYSPCGICPSLNTMQGGQREPKVLIKSNTTKGYTEATAGDSLNIAQPSSKTRRGRVGKGVANTLTTQDTMCAIEEDYRIRKLTPRECFTLMGFQKEDADKLSDNGISNTQLYKQAGNSIVVDVLMGIFGNLKGTLYNV